MTDTEIRTRLQDRLQAIEERVAGACKRAGRARSEVTLVAVTKTVSSRVAGLLPELGIFDLGESRPQELWRKAEALKDLPILWHQIGHVQRNKVAIAIKTAWLVHSIDSARLLDAVNTSKKEEPLGEWFPPAQKRRAREILDRAWQLRSLIAAGQGVPEDHTEKDALYRRLAEMDVVEHGFDDEHVGETSPRLPGRARQLALLEVNASREPNKHGFSLEELPSVLASLDRHPYVKIIGLMTMAAHTEDPEQARPTFNEVRRLRDQFGLNHLSMGMSNDFEIAIEEGATFIRLGSILFDGIDG